MSSALQLFRQTYKRLMPARLRGLAWSVLLWARQLRAEPRRWKTIKPPSLAKPPEENFCSLYNWHIAQATFATQALDSRRALLHLDVLAEARPDDSEIRHRRGIIQLQMIGDLDEAIKQFAAARAIRESQLPAGAAKPPFRFLDAFWGYQIGHIANTEHLIKREILRGNDPKKLVMYFPADAKAGNRALLDKIANLISVVSNEADLPLPRSVMTSVMEEYYVCESIDGRLKHWWHASPEIFEAWESAGRGPLLSFTEDEVAEGRRTLAKLGLPDGAWFVPLHVRESSFKEQQGYGAIEQILNADVAAYAEAVNAIAERGGWVVRIGHEKSPPLPPMRNVIDYAHSAHRSPAADLYILGAGRFFIGTSSGPAYVPPLFGVPCVLTNWAPTGQRPFNARDLYILKTYEEPANGTAAPRPLKFAEFLAPPVGYAASSAEARSLVAVPNTPEEICEVVVEMLDRLDGRPHPGTDVAPLRAQFDTIARASHCIGNAKVGAAFLRRHAGRVSA